MMASPRGAYLDTIADRYVEALLLLGFLFIGLPGVIFPSNVWLFLILFGSTMTTYAKAAASEKKIIDRELKGGLMSRGERMIIYAGALLILNFNWVWVTYILIGLAFLTNITAFQRIASALRIEKKQ
jgi:phosphatidylglycerophosphate synthase